MPYEKNQAERKLFPLPFVQYAFESGGWPLAVGMDKDIALDQAFDYLDAVEQRDIQMADGVMRNPPQIERSIKKGSRKNPPPS